MRRDMDIDAEVIVVGGGLAGCATALHLARVGRQVLVVERGRSASTVRAGKVCGEGLMPHGLAAFRRLGLGEPDGQPFQGIAYHAGGHTAVGSFGAGREGRGVRRSGVDASLALAIDRHPRVQRVEGYVVGLRREARGVAVELRGRPPLRAPVVVGADGLHSSVRRLAGLTRPARGPRRYGARCHLRWPADRPVPAHVHVHAQGGFELYVTPVGPHEVNLALLLDAAGAQRLKGDREAAFRALVHEVPGGAALLDGAEPLSEVAVCGPLRQAVRAPCADSVVLVGDAAGFVDAVTGEGMSLGLLSAELAAQAVDASLTSGRDRRFATYRRRRARLVRDLCTLTELVVFGLRRPAWARRVVAALAARPAAFERFLAVQTGRGALGSLGPAILSVATALVGHAVRGGAAPPIRQLAAPARPLDSAA